MDGYFKCTMLDCIRDTEQAARNIAAHRKENTAELMAYLGEKPVSRIVLVGSGTSNTAAVTARAWMEQITRLPVQAMLPSALLYETAAYDPDALYVFTSQTGTSMMVGEASAFIQAKGYRSVVISESGDTPMAKKGSCFVCMDCGIEEYPMRTVGYTASVMTMMVIALEIAHVYGACGEAEYERAAAELSEIAVRVPRVIEKAVPWAERVRRQLLRSDLVVFTGADELYGAALEGAMKIWETVQTAAVGYEIEDGMRKEILKLSSPIIAQSMIVYLVMAVENLLIGRILPSAFAAMTLTTQIYNITSLVIQGIIGGGNILFAKHFGSRDYDRMRCVIRYEFIFTAVFIGGVSAACLAAPRLVMSILTDHEDLIYLGGIYIRVMGTAWLLASCSMVVTQVLRTIGEAGFPMKVAAAEMTSELIATAAILSSGLSPEGKLRGIALSFLGLKLLEFGVLSVCLGRKTAQWTRSTEKLPGFFGTFFQTVLPVTANELLWSLGTSLLVTFIGRQDQTVIAAYGICVTAESLAGVLMSGLDLSGSMVLGKNIAHGHEKIIKIRGMLRRLALEAGALEIAVLLGMVVLAPRVYNQGEAVNRLAACLLVIDAGVELFKAAQCMNMTGILRPLGDVRFCFLNDILFQWLYIIPGTWLLLNAVQIPFAVVFFFMKTDQVIKVFTSESRINFVLRKNDAEP